MSVYSNNQLKKQASNEAWTKIFGFIKPNTTIIDIGCSSGQLGAALKKEKKVHIIGLELDEADVLLAKKNLDEAYVANIESDDISTYGSFDYVIMADVLEHLVDPVSAIKKVKKVLKPKGQFIFSIPNMANVTTRLELLKGVFTYKDFGLLDRTHLHFYDQTEVTRIFNDAGMIVESTNCTLREVPDELLKRELKAVGMSLTPELHKILSQPDATVYQYIGVAIPGKTPRKMPIATTTQLDIISIEIEEMRAKFEESLNYERQRNDKLFHDNERLDSDLSAIVNSRAWKLASKAQSLKHGLKSKFVTTTSKKHSD